MHQRRRKSAVLSYAKQRVQPKPGRKGLALAEDETRVLECAAHTAQKQLRLQTFSELWRPPFASVLYRNFAEVAH